METCENCNQPIGSTPDMYDRTPVAHSVERRGESWRDHRSVTLCDACHGIGQAAFWFAVDQHGRTLAAIVARLKDGGSRDG